MTHSTAPHLPPIDPTVPHISAPHIPHCPTHFSLTHLCPTYPWGLFLECRGQEWLHVERSRREVGTAVTPVAPVVMSAVTSSVTSSSTSAVTSSGLWGSPTALGSEGEMWDEGMGGGKGDANIYGVRPKWDPNIYGVPPITFFRLRPLCPLFIPFCDPDVLCFPRGGRGGTCGVKGQRDPQPPPIPPSAPHPPPPPYPFSQSHLPTPQPLSIPHPPTAPYPHPQTHPPAPHSVSPISPTTPHPPPAPYPPPSHIPSPPTAHRDPEHGDRLALLGAGTA